MVDNGSLYYNHGNKIIKINEFILINKHLNKEGRKDNSSL